MHSRIFLIGFMGSGKTTHGKQIARMMGYTFVDMDHWIEDGQGKTIPEIFRDPGEAGFRELEAKAIEELSRMERVVIATGGGAPCFGNNLEKMKKAGLTIYLKLTPAALLSRLKDARTRRPLLEGKSEAEMLRTIQHMLKEREPFYSRADMIIDGLDRVTERTVNAIQRM